MPDTQSGTNFYCVGYNVIQFTKEEIETLRTNPNVKQVRENRLDLTYAFRPELYDAWKEKRKDLIVPPTGLCSPKRHSFPKAQDNHYNILYNYYPSP